MLFVAQRVARGRVLQAHSRRDVAGVADIDILTVVGVHLKDAAHALAVILHGVVHRAAGFDNTGVNAEETKLTHERVGRNLERQRRERSIVVGRTGLLFLGVGVYALDVVDVGRSRHVVHDGVEQLLHALVFIGSAAHDRNDRIGDGLLADGHFHLGDGELLTVEIFHHQLFVVFGDGFDQFAAVFLSQLLHILGDLLHADILAQVIVIDVGFHLKQVDNALERLLLADGKLQGDGVRLQAVLDHVQHVIEIRAHDVHLIDVNHAGDMILVGLMPHGLRLRLNTTFCAHNGNAAVQYTQGAFHLNGEVHVARGVDDVDSETVLFGKGRVVLILGMAPIACGGSGSDRDATLLLLRHPVHRRSAVVRLTDFVVDACIEQDALGGRGLACVDMGHNADVSGHFQRNVSWHSFLLKVKTQINICNEQTPCWPLPSCGYPHAFCKRCRCR